MNQSTRMLVVMLCAFGFMSVPRVFGTHHNDVYPDILGEIKYQYGEIIHLHATLNQTLGNVSHFWKSTGFCPPDPHSKVSLWLNSESMIQNLAYIGALPHQAVEQVRVHWLLDAITVHRLGNGSWHYDFSQLDVFIERLNRNGLRPGFEIMGNPDGLFTDFSNKTQLYFWKDLIYQLAKHYIDRYGIKNVRSWNFETWNEPTKHHFGSINMSLVGFTNYYDATWAGLHDASPHLRFGAPGGECKEFSLNRYCWSLLDHIQNGRDIFTKRKPNKPSFISLHKKGEYPDNTAWIMKKESDTLNDIHLHFPRVADVPVYNDEGDPLVDWSREQEWRADATYAAMATKVIVTHHKYKIPTRSGKVKLALLCNDNGFLSYAPYIFTQRTLLARFQINSTQPHHVHMITKPIYNAMGLLSLLGNAEIQTVQTIESKSGSMDKSYTGHLATYRAPYNGNPSTSKEWSILLYHSSDTLKVSGIVRYNLTFSGVSHDNLENMKFVIYQIDNNHGNSYQKWKDLGCPKSPSKKELHFLRKAQGPVRLSGPSVFNGGSLNVVLPNPGVAFLQLCTKPEKPPTKIHRVFVHPITSDEVLISWDDTPLMTRCISTYLVSFSTSISGKYRQINKTPIFFNFFVYAPTNTVNGSLTGYFKVKAVDFWNRKGHNSKPATVIQS